MKALILASAVLLTTATFALADDVVVEDVDPATTNTVVVKERKSPDATAAGAVTGAATGAVVGGPVGAVIGGAVGMTTGAAIDEADKPDQQTVIIKKQQPEAVIVEE